MSFKEKKRGTIKDAIKPNDRNRSNRSTISFPYSMHCYVLDWKLVWKRHSKRMFRKLAPKSLVYEKIEMFIYSMMCECI